MFPGVLTISKHTQLVEHAMDEALDETIQASITETGGIEDIIRATVAKVSDLSA